MQSAALSDSLSWLGAVDANYTAIRLLLHALNLLMTVCSTERLRVAGQDFGFGFANAAAVTMFIVRQQLGHFADNSSDQHCSYRSLSDVLRSF